MKHNNLGYVLTPRNESYKNLIAVNSEKVKPKHLSPSTLSDDEKNKKLLKDDVLSDIDEEESEDDDVEANPQVLYYSLNSYLKETDWYVRQSKRVESQQNKLMEALCMDRASIITVLGEKDVGKRTLVYSTIQRIMAEDCPECLKDTQFVSIKPMDFCSSTANGILSMLATVVRTVIFSSNPEIMDWVIDNAEKLVGIESVDDISKIIAESDDAELIEESDECESKSVSNVASKATADADSKEKSPTDFDSLLKGKICFVFENFNEYPETFIVYLNSIFNRLKGMFSFLESLKIVFTIDNDWLRQWPSLSGFIESYDELYVMGVDAEYKMKNIFLDLEDDILDLQEKYGIKHVSKNAKQILYSKLVATSGLDVSHEEFIKQVEAFMIRASRAGHNELNSKFIVQYYVDSFKARPFKMSKETVIATAKHEAGHTLIGIMWPEMFKFMGVLSVSSEEDFFAGVTLLLSNPYTCEMTERDCIRQIAMLLAGRISEGSKNLGASSDLRKAQKCAETFILNGGKSNLYKKTASKNEKKQIKELIKSGEKLAKKIIKDNQEFLDALSKKLAKKRYMSAEEVQKLFAKYGKNKKDYD